MKKLLLFFLLFVSNVGFAQVVYSNSEDPKFIAMLKNGVTFIPSSNQERSAAIYAALEKNWKVSSLRIYNSDVELQADDIVIMETTFSVFTTTNRISDDMLIWVRFGDLSKDQNPIVVGRISTNGFTNDSKDPTLTAFWDLAISGVNDVVQVIKNENLVKKKSKISAEVSNKILPKAKVLETKTLLIHYGIEQYVNTKALESNKIRYKVINSETFNELAEAERSQSCLLYYSKNVYTEVSIFDLSNNSLIYTKRFLNAKRQFTLTDILEISELWMQP